MSALGGEEGSETTKYDDDRTQASAPPPPNGTREDNGVDRSPRCAVESWRRRGR